MNVITEHHAFGEDGQKVAVGMTVRHAKGLFDDYRKEFDARITMTVDEARELVEALQSTNCAEFEKAQDDGGYINVIKELHEGAWIEWHDKEGREVREPFSFGRDGWSERFAEAVDRGIKEALL